MDEGRNAGTADFLLEAGAGRGAQVLELPTDKPRPATQSFRGATETFRLPGKLLERLKTLGREQQATLFMVLEAAFMALLHRYTGQDDIVVGTPISGRTRSETENLIGFFLNTLLLRARFGERESFLSLVQQVRERALGAYAHPDLPFEHLVAELAPDRDPSRMPLFQVMFIVHNSEGVSQVSKVSGNHESGNRDLEIRSDADSLRDRQGPRRVDRIQHRFVRTGHHSPPGQLLRAAAGSGRGESGAEHLRAADAARGRAAAVAGGVERHRRRHTRQISACTSCSRRRPRARPDRVALVFEERELTYGELDRRANQLAHHLARWASGPTCWSGSVRASARIDMVVGAAGHPQGRRRLRCRSIPAIRSARLAFMIEDRTGARADHRAADRAILPASPARGRVRSTATPGSIAAHSPAAGMPCADDVISPT